MSACDVHDAMVRDALASLDLTCLIGEGAGLAEILSEWRAERAVSAATFDPYVWVVSAAFHEAARDLGAVVADEPCQLCAVARSRGHMHAARVVAIAAGEALQAATALGIDVELAVWRSRLLRAVGARA